MESAAAIKAFVGKTSLHEFASGMVVRMVLAFILHQGRMSCSQAAGSIASQAIHRGQRGKGARDVGRGTGNIASQAIHRGQLTPSGYRIPWQIPHYTQQYRKKNGPTHRTTAESAACNSFFGQRKRTSKLARRVGVNGLDGRLLIRPETFTMRVVRLPGGILPNRRRPLACRFL